MSTRTRRGIWSAIFTTFLIRAGLATAQAQSNAVEKFEVGAHLLYRVYPYTTTTSTPTGFNCQFICVPTGFKTLETGYVESSFGVGGRFGYKLSGRIDLEGNINYFQDSSQDNRLPGGIQGLFGAKSGWRGRSIAFYGKLRFGFLHYEDTNHLSASCYRSPLDTPCFDTPMQIDVGGIFEFYRTHKFFPRIEAGDVMTRYRSQFGTVDFRHSLQMQIGTGYRF
jgi:hypothetical protein